MSLSRTHTALGHFSDNRVTLMEGQGVICWFHIIACLCEELLELKMIILCLGLWNLRNINYSVACLGILCKTEVFAFYAIILSRVS